MRLILLPMNGVPVLMASHSSRRAFSSATTSVYASASSFVLCASLANNSYDAHAQVKNVLTRHKNQKERAHVDDMAAQQGEQGQGPSRQQLALSIAQQFVQNYYSTFDANRGQLSSCYVRTFLFLCVCVCYFCP